MHSNNNSTITITKLHPLHHKELQNTHIKSNFRMQGSYKTPVKRVTKSPDSSRPYINGDPPARIDWKTYAKSNQLIVREQRDAASCFTNIIIDISETMDWPNTKNQENIKNLPKKIELASRITFHLAYIHLRLGDQVSIWILKDKNEKNLTHCYRPRSPAEILDMFNQILANEFSNAFIEKYFNKAPYPTHAIDRLYFVTDALGIEKLNRFSNSILKRSNQVPFLIHTVSSLELDFSWLNNKSTYYFKQDKKKEFQGEELKNNSNYIKEIEKWKNKLNHEIKSLGGVYFLANDCTSIDSYFRFLKSSFSIKF